MSLITLAVTAAVFVALVVLFYADARAQQDLEDDHLPDDDILRSRLIFTTSGRSPVSRARARDDLSVR